MRVALLLALVFVLVCCTSSAWAAPGSNRTVTNGTASASNSTANNSTMGRKNVTTPSSDKVLPPPDGTITLPGGEVWHAPQKLTTGEFKSFAKGAHNKVILTANDELIPLDKSKRYAPASTRDRATLKAFMSSLSLHPTPHSAKTLLNGCQTPDHTFLQKWQSLIKNQKGRQTSTSFAAIGALEAAYRRYRGRRVVLSEQFFTWAGAMKRFSFGRRRRSSLWLQATSHDAADTLETYATTLSRTTLYASKEEMHKIVRNAKHTGALPSTKARRHDIDNFEMSEEYISSAQKEAARFGATKVIKLWQADVRNTCNMERILSNNHEVIVDFKLNWKREGQVMNYDSSPKHRGGYHTMLVVGYDKRAGEFLCKNSWGGTKYVRVSYLFMQRAAMGGAVISGVIRPSGATSYQRMLRMQFVGLWHADFNGRRGRLVIRRNTPSAFVGTFYPIANSIKGRQRVQATWNKEEGSRSMQMIVGSKTYKMYIHAHDRKFMSGVQKGVYLHGAILSKVHRHWVKPKHQFTTSDLKGVWRIIADGVHAGDIKLGKYGKKNKKLTSRVIETSFQDIRGVGRYAHANVLYRGAFGGSGRAVRVQVSMGIDGEEPWLQTYYLFVHTKEQGTMSGYTRKQNGAIVPLMAFRKK